MTTKVRIEHMDSVSPIQIKEIMRKHVTGGEQDIVERVIPLADVGEHDTYIYDGRYIVVEELGSD